MRKKALITGAFGFIGRYTALEYYKRGYNVIGIGHGGWNETEYNKWGISEFYDLDITIENLLKISKKFNVIVHCAGSASVARSFQNPIQDFERTVITTLNLLEYIKNYSIDSKLVYLSSAAVYGESDENVLAENMVLNPISPYGLHKKIAEEICEDYSKNYGLNIVILRLFSVYGVGLKKQLLWDACNKISTNKNIFWGSGDETRDWINIKDLVKFIFFSSNYADETCTVYNIGSGHGISVKEILGIVFKYFNINEVPQFNGMKDNGNPLRYVANIEKIKKWNIDLKYGIEEGIKEYVQWFKNKQ